MGSIPLLSYIYINIDPVIFYIGPFALRWYGLMYVVGIVMALFGALFLAIPVLFWRAKVERINPLVALDGGVLFAAAGQIFGRIGNIINGDIVGYRSNLPWATVYQNPHSFLCVNLADPTQCGSVVTA